MSSGNILTVVLYFVVIIGIGYFFLVRPQKKEKQRMEALLDSMSVGDAVVTTSGFYGKVIDISDDDCIVEFGSNKNCRIPMQKQAIALVEKADDAYTKAEDKE